jgi:hypothetical protein
LAQRDHCIELAIEWEGPGIESLKGRERRRAVTCNINEGLRDIDAVHLYTECCKRVRVAAGTAPNVKHSHSWFEFELVNEERDFIRRTHRE